MGPAQYTGSGFGEPEGGADGPAGRARCPRNAPLGRPKSSLHGLATQQIAGPERALRNDHDDAVSSHERAAEILTLSDGHSSYGALSDRNVSRQVKGHLQRRFTGRACRVSPATFANPQSHNQFRAARPPVWASGQV